MKEKKIAWELDQMNNKFLSFSIYNFEFLLFFHFIAPFFVRNFISENIYLFVRCKSARNATRFNNETCLWKIVHGDFDISVYTFACLWFMKRNFFYWFSEVWCEKKIFHLLQYFTKIRKKFADSVIGRISPGFG